MYTPDPSYSLSQETLNALDPVAYRQAKYARGGVSPSQGQVSQSVSSALLPGLKKEAWGSNLIVGKQTQAWNGKDLRDLHRVHKLNYQVNYYKELTKNIAMTIAGGFAGAGVGAAASSMGGASGAAGAAGGGAGAAGAGGATGAATSGAATSAGTSAATSSAATSAVASSGGWMTKVVEIGKILGNEGGNASSGQGFGTFGNIASKAMSWMNSKPSNTTPSSVAPSSSLGQNKSGYNPTYKLKEDEGFGSGPQ
jgi:hypothetical protein